MHCKADIEAREPLRRELAAAMAEFERRQPVSTEPIRPAPGGSKKQRWVDDMGIMSQPGSARARAKRARGDLARKARELRAARILELHGKGKNKSEIAAELECDRGTVTYWLIKQGVEL